MATDDRSESSIEDIILSEAWGDISALRPHLVDDYCMDAARFMYDRPGTAFLVTGFYEDLPDTIETDGPPGALAIGRAWEGLGRKVVYVTDRHCVPFLEPEAGEAEVVDFPITGQEESRAFSRSLLDKYDPSIVLAIERPSLNKSGRYLNLNTPQTDITAFTARIDELFNMHSATVGVGDGGNEIGMGNLKDIIPMIPTLASYPAETGCTRLVICSISNWGGYGLATALSILAGQDLLRPQEEEAGIIKRMVDNGAVDGGDQRQTYTVDGKTLDENLEILERLRQVVRSNIADA